MVIQAIPAEAATVAGAHQTEEILPAREDHPPGNLPPEEVRIPDGVHIAGAALPVNAS
jgi:hypothetical protein